MLLPTPVDALAADATGSPPVGVCAGADVADGVQASVGVGVLQGTTGVSPMFISLIACRLHAFAGVCVGVGVAVNVLVGVRV